MDKRITVALYIVTLIFGIFLIRLWDLQIIKGGEYRRIEERNRLRVIDIPAPRGIIYDRNNKAFVNNVPSFDISVVKEELPRDDETLLALGELVGLAPDYIRKRLSASLRSFEPVKLKQDVSFEEVAKVEARKIDFPGLQVDVVNGREYVFGHSASHVIGYLGKPSLKQLRSSEFSDVPRDSFIGQFGVEKVYDNILRGNAGKKIIEVNALGSIVKVVRIQRPVKGTDIKLTIDADLQVEAERSLSGKAGAVVAIKPGTGEILAMASSPSFDPNLFVRGIKEGEWKKLIKDPGKPFLNRAIQSRYPPGSTFKIITAIAALEEGLISKNTKYKCKGSINFGGRKFRCWKKEGHGSVDIHKALVESCDVFFYEVAKKLDIDILAEYAFDYGLGSVTGVELEGEVPGIVPNTWWKRETRNTKWYKGETLNTVIGQGYLSVTPIQMARLTAAVVNGGKLYETFIVADPGREIEPESVLNIDPRNIELVRKALMDVVQGKRGTGRIARSDVVDIGGKTGTTQVIGGVPDDKDQKAIPEKFRDHAWFVAFAPEDDPQIAVSVFVEHGGHGSSAAAPIAKRIIEAYYKNSVQQSAVSSELKAESL
jgi:penicillin-binding protein 2